MGGDVGHIVGPWYSNVGSFTPPGFAALAQVGELLPSDMVILSHQGNVRPSLTQQGSAQRACVVFASYHIQLAGVRSMARCTAPIFCDMAAGNTEQRPAQNEAAWDDHSAPRLYDMTKKIVDEKTANL